MNVSSTKAALKHKFYGLDHLRALAIILVFLFHYGRLFPHPEWTNRISTFGWTGVDLFFVLSGYLIASQLFLKIANGEPISVKHFYLKRFFRIIPAYIVVVILYFSFPVLREREALAPLWKYLTFTQNLGLDLSSQGTFSHAWSLCIEEQFYLLLPIILIALVSLRIIKKGAYLLLFLFAAGFLIRTYVWHSMVAPYSEQDNFGLYWYRWIYYPTYCRLDGLLVGVSIAAWFQFRPSIKDRLDRYGNHLFILSLCVLSAAYFLCLDTETFAASIFGFPLVSLGYGIMVIAVLTPSCFLYTWKSKISTSLAALSYSIYLSHKIVIHVTQQLFLKTAIAEIDSNTIFFVCLITCFSGALFLNIIIEKPFLKLRDYILSGKAKETPL